MHGKSIACVCTNGIEYNSLALNSASGRSFHDLSRYPVYPWVISDYTSSKLNLKVQNLPIRKNLRSYDKLYKDKKYNEVLEERICERCKTHPYDVNWVEANDDKMMTLRPSSCLGKKRFLSPVFLLSTYQPS